MHDNSYALMKEYLDSLPDGPRRVLDVGSLDVNGTYRPLCDRTEWSYCGIDQVAGPNVAIQVTNDNWANVPLTFDTVISGQAFEHAAHPVGLITRIKARLAYESGEACIIAPSAGPVHHEPDYWRIQPDGWRHLAKQAGLKIVDLTVSDVEPWRDIRVIMRRA